MLPPPLIIYKISNYLHNKKLRRLSKIVSLSNRFFFRCWIPGSASIGKNFKIGYWGIGLIIHSNTVIGDNCLIAQNVTIGRNFGDLNVPVIGDDVYVGTGSVVFGEIRIGNNVIIGANTVVNKDIPDNCTVVGNPMRIIAVDRDVKYYEIDKLKGIKSE